jgi:hypothetical protein
MLLTTCTQLILLLTFIAAVFAVCTELERQKGQILPSHEHTCGLSILLAPINFIVGNGDGPVLDVTSHKSLYKHEVDAFVEQWETIRDEAFNVTLRSIEGDLFFGSNLTHDKKWFRYYVKWYGHVATEAREKMPVLCSLLDQHDDVALAMLSLLKPGAVIMPHVGISRAAIRVHISLQSPEEAFIEVDGQRLHWQDGHALAFDDTFYHKAANPSDQSRLILFLDIKKKGLGTARKIIRDLLITATRVFTASQHTN